MSSGAGEQAVGERTIIESPASWVPFQADVRIYLPGYNPSFGKFARDSNGSVWMTTGPTIEDQRVVSIRNIPSATYYVRRDGKWEKSMMEVDSANYRAPKRRSGGKGLEPFPFKVAALPGQAFSVFATEGIDVWRAVTLDGSTRLEAPALNFFAIVSQEIGGKRQEFINIAMGEPSSSLFEPPSGEEVKFIGEIRGINRSAPAWLHEKGPSVDHRDSAK